MKRLISLVLVLCLLFATGCAKPGEKAESGADVSRPAGAAASAPGAASDGADGEALCTTLAYVPQRVDCPREYSSIWGWDTCADTVWMGCTSNAGEYIAAVYDTLSDT